MGLIIAEKDITEKDTNDDLCFALFDF